MSSAKKWEFIVWWIFRLIMIGAMVSLLFTNPPSDLPKTQMALQLFANLVGMFAWEIIQALPEKNCLRQLPSYCQTVASVGLLLASFGGAFLNFYYSIFMWDKILHLLCALGFSFFISTCWELFEFSFDQIAGGDSQHWSYELAKAANNTRTFFKPRDPARFALMDTMTDIVFNTLGAVPFYIILKIAPYHHKGKNNVNEMFAPKGAEKEFAQAK